MATTFNQIPPIDKAEAIWFEPTAAGGMMFFSDPVPVLEMTVCRRGSLLVVTNDQGEEFTKEYPDHDTDVEDFLKERHEIELQALLASAGKDKSDWPY